MSQVLTPARQNGILIPAALVGLVAFYVLGIDQGLLLSVVHGSTAFDQNLLHELVHDARHAGGFPCH